MRVGLLLAGGRSSRFGSEKAIAPWRGRLMMDGPLDALRATAQRVAVSAAPGSGAERHAEGLGLPILADNPAHPRGPLAGLHAGLAWARGLGAVHLLSATCDAADLDAVDLLRLIAAASVVDGAALTTGVDGPQPLIALWPVDLALERLGPELKAGRHPPVRRVLDQLHAVSVSGYAGGNVNTTAAASRRDPL